MEILDLKQGTEEWEKARLEYFTASEAPAMMGVSPYMSRTELLKLKKTGISKKVSPAQQRLFDKGHKAEAMARPLAEDACGDELFPTVGIEGNLLASFDGITMDEEIIFEHKLWNERLVAAVEAEELPEHYYVQMDQQLMVSGAKQCIFVVSDGTPDNFKFLWYEGDEKRQSKIKAGWDQFKKDLEEFDPSKNTDPSEPVKVEIENIDNLPAIRVDVSGEVLASNVDDFCSAVQLVIDNLPEDPKTDEEIGLINAYCKASNKIEKDIPVRIDEILKQAGQIFDEIKKLEGSSKELRKKRLWGEKIVVSAKQQIIADIHQEFKQKFADWKQQNEFHRGDIDLTKLKGRRTIKGLREAAEQALADAKIHTTEINGLIDRNRDKFKDIMPEELNNELTFKSVQDSLTLPEDQFEAKLKSYIFDWEKQNEARLKREQEEKERKEREEKEAAERKAQAEKEAAERKAREEKEAEERRKAEEERLEKQRKENEERDRKLKEEQKRLEAERKQAAEEQARIDEQKEAQAQAAVSQEGEKTIIKGELRRSGKQQKGTIQLFVGDKGFASFAQFADFYEAQLPAEIEIKF